MTLRDTLTQGIKDAMKAKDSVRLSTLRLVMAAVKDRDIAARSEDRCGGIDDGEILALLSKMVKQREDSAQTYEDNARPELADRERTEMAIMREYMPQPLTEAETAEAVEAAVREAGATCLKDMGKIMGRLKADYPGRIDMGKAGAIVKAQLCAAQKEAAQ